MRVSRRFRASLLASLLLLLPLATAATSQAAVLDDTPSAEEQALAQMELRAQQSKPKEQCFLYAELVHSLTEIAGRQLLDGDSDRAAATLKRMERSAQLLHQSISKDAARLKNAELLLHNTTFKLTSLLRATSGDDRLTLQATLSHMNQLHDELLAQVFTR